MIPRLARPAAIAAAWVAVLTGCRTAPPAPVAPDEGSGEVQAIIELGDAGGVPFLAERGVLAALYPDGSSGQLVIHASSDLDDRLALALVFDLADPALPGAVDLARHAVVLMELDRGGEAGLVLDGTPVGSAELHGTFEPGGEVVGTFNLALSGRDEIDAPLVARIDGTFSVIVAAEATAGRSPTSPARR